MAAAFKKTMAGNPTLVTRRDDSRRTTTTTLETPMTSINRVRATTIGLFLLLAAPSLASGQALGAVMPNTRIRVELLSTQRSRFGRQEPQSIIGVMAGVRADTVLLLSGEGTDPICVPLNATRQVFVSGGSPRRWRAALKGAVIPALTGFALTSITARIRPRVGDPSALQQAASSAAWGAATGAVFGALSPKERWNALSAP